MLSVRRRQDARGVGFRGGAKAAAMEDNDELEEGEACGDDDDAFVDPDIALSYIDEKLQDVLGHFQKDFEGGVSAENLGAKFGGYGSFLPTYQRSPPHLSQARSPPKVANCSTSRSPCHQPAEGTRQNPSAVVVSSVSRDNGSAVPLADDLGKKERCSSTKGEKDYVSRYDSLDGSVNGSDQKTLKVRIKVGPDNILTRNNAAIYSGLGLDVSSSSSMEDSPDGHGGLSPEFSKVPYESPRTILQIMTCFSVPGGFLLSPLRGNVLQLTKKVVPLLNKWKTNLDTENVSGTYEALSDTTLPLEDVKGHAAKRMKPDGKKKKSVDVKNTKNIDGISAIMKREIDIEMPAGQEIISDALNIPLLSNSRTMEVKAENLCAEESARTTRIPDPFQENKNVQLKERMSTGDLVAMKAEAAKAEVMEHIDNDGIENPGNNYTASKGKLKLKTSKTEKALEERNMTNHKNSPFDWKQESKVKVERKFDAVKVDFEGYEGKKEQAVGPAENVKNMYDASGENNSRSEDNRMQKEQKINGAPSFDFLEDDKGMHFSAAVKERKNDSQLKSSQFGKKSKVKSHRALDENIPKGSYGDKEGDVLENGSSWGELRQKEKMIVGKNDNEQESVVPGEARKEIPANVKHDRHPVSEAQQTPMPPTGSVAAADATPSLVPPVVIEEHWVCCDICQKWRLLPYEMDPSTLPKKWKCSLLHWLPGMNRCDISENETTNALNALYMIPVPATGISSGGHHHIAAAGIATSSTNHINGQLEQSRKRKNPLKDGTSLAECSYSTKVSAPPTSNQQALIKHKSSIDAKQYPFERDSLSKADLGPVSKSADFVIERQKSKHKNRGSYSDGGDLMERSKKHLKVKSKRGIDQDECKASKKTKKEDRHYFGKDRDPECDLAGQKVPDEAKILPAKATAKSLREQNDVSSCKEKTDSKHDLLEKSNRTKDEDLVFSKEENKEHFHPSDVERLDLSSKKRIMKEWEESQHNSVAQSKGSTVDNSCVAKETYAKNVNLKEKKSKIVKSEEMVSRMDSRPGKLQDADPVLSSNAGRLNNELDDDSKLSSGKEGPSALWQNLPSGQAMDLGELTKRDVGYVQTSRAATSSSSKVSGSRKNKANSQEARGSPVESVSSSPLRISNNDKLSHTRNLGKDGALNADSSTVASPIRYPNTEVGMADNGSGQVRNSQESQVAGGSAVRGSLQGSSDNSNKEVIQLTRGHASDGINLERGLDNDLQQISGRKDLSVKGSSRGYNHLHSGDKRSLDTDGPSMQPDQHSHFDSRAAALDSKGDSIMHENKKRAPSRQDRYGSVHFLSDGNQQSDLPSGKEKPQPRSDKQEIQKPVIQMVRSPIKENKLEVHSTSVKSDASKMAPQLRRCDVENGVQHSIVRQAICNPADTSSPIRKDGNLAAYALKEARDLKHKANRLKNEGQELESTGLYFEAALKFLHVASLLEPPSFDSLKQGDAAQSMKMYSDTAKLCDFCAHAYERCKKMAAAALAYKCVEVAYLKAAYYKHPSASKDRPELQAAVQIPPGESPSSSASDIDNLNSQGLSKAPSNKDANSPQVAGNHLIASRNQPHLLRLLAYTNDVSCAFDATRKLQIAIASAAGIHGKGVDDGLASVRAVLDFNFHNVNELLRLVRLSMESICR